MILLPPRSTPFPYNHFFFNDTATTEIYPLSLHDALPISLGDCFCRVGVGDRPSSHGLVPDGVACQDRGHADRKSTRLNSSHQIISYAVFCLKKKKKLIDTSSHDTLMVLAANAHTRFSMMR